MPRRNVTILIAAVVFCWFCYQRDENDPFARYVAEGFEKIDDFAYDDVPEDELFEGAMRGMVSVLRERGDPHTGFIPQQRKSRFDEEFEQQFGGINVRLRVDGEPPRLVIAPPLSIDSPARAAGIRTGDMLVAVDGDSIGDITDREFERVLRMVRGRPGTAVEIGVQRPGEDGQRSFRIVRELVDVESVVGDTRDSEGKWNYFVSDEPKVALLRILEFGNQSAAELGIALEQVVEQGAEAVLLDLRHNPGGPLPAGTAVSELFLSAGQPIVHIKNRDGEITEQISADSNGPFRDVKLIVLLDGDSASASELVAGCLRDNERALIAGQRSYGKGTVQRVIHTQAGKSYLKLTTSTFWPPSDRQIHRPLGDEQRTEWGIAPSDGLAVEMSDEEQLDLYRARRQRDAAVTDDPAYPLQEDYSDPVVDAAIEYLRNVD